MTGIEQLLISAGFTVIFGLICTVWWLLLLKINAIEARAALALTEAGALRERLAKDYHDAVEVRQLIQDLVAPMRDQLTSQRDQLTRIETILQILQGSNFTNRQ